MDRLIPGCRTIVCALTILGVTAGVKAQPVTGLEAAAALEQGLVNAIAKAEKSVVAIARVRREPPGERLVPEFRPNPFGRVPAAPPKPTDFDFVPNEFATGTVVDASGLVLTVYHVLGDDSDYYITTHDRKVFRARIIGADPRSDLAVLAPDESSRSRLAAGEFSPVTLGDASALRRGQFVVALGNPYAIARDGQASASLGIVANLARKAPAAPDDVDPAGKSTIHHFGTLIQTDARLNLGTSGGPLVNLKGEMVGMTTAIPAAIGFEESAGYAIPVDATFRRVLETLKLGREVEYGFLGIEPRSLGLDESRKGLHGIRVFRVVPGAPAQRQGIRPGDLVTRVNGVPIHDADGLVLEVGRMPPESTVRLSVLRREQPVDVQVELMKYRVRGKKVVTAPAPDWRGMRIDYASAADDGGRPGVALLGVPEAVAVVEVAQGTPAWEAGMRPGMLVSHVDRAAVRTPKQFREAVATKAGPVRLRVAGEGGAAASAERTVPPAG